MQREIKFRAWSKTLECMITVRNINDLKDKNLNCMQYTGLKDKNGKEIYEGDILNASRLYVVYYTYANASLICLPIKEYKYLMREMEEYEIVTDIDYSDMTEYCFSNMLLKHFEVIGNIYENPELLEG